MNEQFVITIHALRLLALTYQTNSFGAIKSEKAKRNDLHLLRILDSFWDNKLVANIKYQLWKIETFDEF